MPGCCKISLKNHLKVISNHDLLSALYTYIPLKENIWTFNPKCVKRDKKKTLETLLKANISKVELLLHDNTSRIYVKIKMCISQKYKQYIYFMMMSWYSIWPILSKLNGLLIKCPKQSLTALKFEGHI